MEDATENRRIVDFIIDELERRRTDRDRFSQQWRLNDLFVNGEQWYRLVHGKIRKDDYVENSAIYNVLSTIITSRKKTMYVNDPKITIDSIDNEFGKSQEAIRSEKIYNALWNIDDMSRKHIQMNSYLERTGNAFYMLNWENTKGNTASITSITGETSKVKSGRPITKVVSPFNIFPEYITDSTLDETNSLMYVQRLDIATANKLFPSENLDMATINPLDRLLDPQKYWNTEQNLDSDGNAIEYIDVVHYYERANDKYPKGRTIVTAGDNLIDYQEELIYQVNGEREFPFIQFKQNADTEMFFSRSVLEDCIPLQMRFNELLNNLTDMTVTMATNRVIIKDGTILNEEDLEYNDPFTFIRMARGTDGNDIPQIMKQDNGSLNFIMSALNIVINHLELSTGVSMQTIIGSASGIRSGVQAAQANTSSESNLKQTTDNIVQGSQRHAVMVLSFYKQFAKHDSIIPQYDNYIQEATWNKDKIVTDTIKVENVYQINETATSQLTTKLNLVGAGIYNKGETQVLDPAFVAEIKAKVGDPTEEEIITKEQANIKNNAFIIGNLCNVKDKEAFEYVLTDFDDPYSLMLDIEKFMISNDMRKLKENIDKTNFEKVYNNLTRMHKQCALKIAKTEQNKKQQYAQMAQLTKSLQKTPK